MFDPERRIEVAWDAAVADLATYTVRLTILVEDRKGMLAEISSKISNINTNISNMEAHAGEGDEARVEVTVQIADLKHLEKVIKAIKNVAGVLDVERSARLRPLVT
jgi:GTP pyrophosphokinase